MVVPGGFMRKIKMFLLANGILIWKEVNLAFYLLRRISKTRRSKKRVPESVDLFIILPQAPGIPDLRRINQDKRDDHKSSKSADFRSRRRNLQMMMHKYVAVNSHHLHVSLLRRGDRSVDRPANEPRTRSFIFRSISPRIVAYKTRVDTIVN